MIDVYLELLLDINRYQHLLTEIATLIFPANIVMSGLVLVTFVDIYRKLKTRFLSAMIAIIYFFLPYCIMMTWITWTLYQYGNSFHVGMTFYTFDEFLDMQIELVPWAFVTGIGILIAMMTLWRLRKRIRDEAW